MDRAKLQLPTRFEFSTETSVRISDLNYGAHLGNDSILSFINEARVRFLKRNGFIEANIEGLGLIMVDSVIVYKAQSLYGDILRIEVTTDHLNDYGCDFLYRITNRETGKEIARAKTGIVFFDYEKERMAKVPDSFRRTFASE